MKFLSVILTALLLILVCQLADAMKRAGKTPVAPHATSSASQGASNRQSYNL